MADKSLDFNKLKKRKPAAKPVEKPKVVYKEVEVLPTTDDEPPQPPVDRSPAPPSPRRTTKKKGKVGRKSWKDADVDYMRVSFDTPIGTYQKIKQLLATKFFGKYIAQDEMINVAINEFIKKHMKE